METALRERIGCQDTREVQRLLVGCHYHGNADASLLALAVERGGLGMVQILHRAGFDLGATYEGGSMLHIAAKYAQGEVLSYLVEQLGKKAVNSVNSDEESVLSVACLHQHHDVVHMLLGEETTWCDVNLPNNNQQTALHHVASWGHVPSARLLLKHHATVDNRDDLDKMLGETPLMYAAKCGHSNVVSLLLDASADPSKTNKHGESSLVLAAKNGHSDTVKFLLSKLCTPQGNYLQNGNDPWHMDLNPGFTTNSPLAAAAVQGHVKVMRLLLQTQAPIISEVELALQLVVRAGKVDVMEVLLSHLPRFQAGIEGESPDTMYPSAELHSIIQDVAYEACDGVHASILERLLTRFACKVNHVYKDGDSLLHRATASNNLAAIKLLIQAGAEPYVKDHNGMTPLAVAVCKNNKEVTGYLLQIEQEHGNPHSEDMRNATVLFAISQGTCGVEVLKLLVDAGFDLDPKNAKGQTPLLIATYQQKTDMVRFLINQGSDVNTQDIDGHSPIYFAATSNNLDLALLLLNASCNVGLQCWVDKQTPTALQVAGRLGHSNMCRLLLESTATKSCNFHQLQALLKADLRQDCVRELLHDVLDNPFSLMSLCRRSIRPNFHGNKEEAISTLEIPSRIKSYLCMEEYIRC